MVFVNRLAKVAALLLVPPIAVGIAELSLDEGRVDVSAVLRVSKLATAIEPLSLFLLLSPLSPPIAVSLTMLGSSASDRVGYSGYFSSRTLRSLN